VSDPRNAHEKLLALLAVRDARDELERAVGWIVQVRHEDAPETLLGTFGPWSEPAGALTWAAAHEAELNEEPGEEGFRCLVLPIMPVT
jgi:hypothetical protein